MAASFVGLPVLIQLQGGGTAQGTVFAVDGQAGTIELEHASITTRDGARFEQPRTTFQRHDVAGLELLAVNKARPSPPAPAPAKPTRSHQQQQERPLQPWHAEDSDFDARPISQQRFPHSPVPSPHASPKPGTPRSQRQRAARGYNKRGARAPAEWDEVDASDEADSHVRLNRNRPTESFDEDFDFGAGLESFDKKAVFEGIRANDTIDPSLRLVAHNRNSAHQSRTPQSKLLASESVLTVEELEAQQLDRKVALEDAAAAKTDMATPARRVMTVEELEAGVKSVSLEQEVDRGYEYGVDERQSGGGGHTRLFRTETGIIVPTVKSRQWREALNIAQIESAPSPSQRLELAAYQLVTFVLTHVAQKFGLVPVPSPPQSRPSILVACGTECEKSNVVLRAAVLLANRGCRVVALVCNDPDDHDAAGHATAASGELKTNLRVLSSAGGRIVRDVGDLPPTFNLVIEALSDSESPSSASSSATTTSAAAANTTTTQSSSASPRRTKWQEFAISAARWINRLDRGAITISLDVPFGVSHDGDDKGGRRGETSAADDSITPTFILSRSLPRPGALKLVVELSESCESSSGSSTPPPPPQVFVADVGFSPTMWDRIGLEFEPTNATAVWAAEGIVRVSIDGR